VLHIHVITGIAFRDIPVGIRKLPLSYRGARIVTGHGGCRGADLGQESHLHVIPVEVSTYVQLLERYFTGALTFRRTAQSVIDRVIVVVDIVGIHPNFRREVLSVENRIVVARNRVHPGKIAVGERGLIVDRSGRCRSRCGCRGGGGLSLRIRRNRRNRIGVRRRVERPRGRRGCRRGQHRVRFVGLAGIRRENLTPVQALPQLIRAYDSSARREIGSRFRCCRNCGGSGGCSRRCGGCGRGGDRDCGVGSCNYRTRRRAAGIAFR